MEVGKARSQINQFERGGTMPEEKKANTEQDLKERIRQDLLQRHDSEDKEEIEFLLKRL
jgi:hypothetical protein